MNILKYKDYEGTAEIDMDRQVCRGKILFINDLVTYEAESPKELQKEFEAAVDDYIETCAMLGRDAQKPLKGQFNVRVSPRLHKDAVLKSYHENVSLNEIVNKSLECYLYSTHNFNHNLNITIKQPESENRVNVSASTGAPKWLNLLLNTGQDSTHAYH